MINILKICYSSYGGSGVVASELGLALCQKKYNVHFLSHSQPIRLSFQNTGNIIYHQVPTVQYPLFEFPPYESAMVSKIINIVENHKINIIHVHYAIPYAFVAYTAKQILAKRNYDVKLITTLHGTDITLVGKDKSFSTVVEYSINMSDKITAVSNWLKKESYNNFNIVKNIEVVHNFVQCKMIQASDINTEYIKKNIDYKEGELIFSHVSNFRKVKKIDDIINAFSKIYSRINAKLILCGEGPERYKLMELSKKLKLCDKVFFLGNVSNIYAVYKLSQVYINSSESESFGLSALEAMACGNTVITSDCGGITEFVSNNKNGFVVPIGDVLEFANKMIKLNDDPELRGLFIKNSSTTANNFTKEKITSQYEKIYHSIM